MVFVEFLFPNILVPDRALCSHCSNGCEAHRAPLSDVNNWWCMMDSHAWALWGPFDVSNLRWDRGTGVRSEGSLPLNCT